MAISSIVVEKRVALLSADTLAELSALDARLDDGSGRVWIRLSVDESREKDVLRLLRAEGYAKVDEA